MSCDWRFDEREGRHAPGQFSDDAELDAAFAQLQALLDARTPATGLDGELSCCGRPRRCRGCRKPAWGGLAGLHPEYWSTELQ